MKVVLFLAKYVALLLLTLLLSAAVRGACQQDFLQLMRQTFIDEPATSVCTPWFALTAGILLLMGLLRGVTAIWNMTYTIGLTLTIFLICLSLFGSTYALPGPLSELPQLSFLSSLGGDYPALLYLIPLAAVLGGIFSNSRLRITFYSVVSYALWYGLSELLLYLLMIWQQSDDPVFPEVLVLLSDSSWIIPAILGIFFSIYSVVLAFYETYSPRSSKIKHRNEEISQELTEREMPEALTAAELNPTAVNLVPDADPTAPLHPGIPPTHPIGHAPVCTPEEQSRLPLVPPPPPVPSANPNGARTLPPTAASLNVPPRGASPAPTAKADNSAPTAASTAVTPLSTPPPAPLPVPAPLPSTAAATPSVAPTSAVQPTAAAQIVAVPVASAPTEAASQANTPDTEHHTGDSAIAAALAALPAEDSSAAQATDQAPTVPLPPTETFAEIRAALSDMREAREEAEQQSSAAEAEQMSDRSTADSTSPDASAETQVSKSVQTPPAKETESQDKTCDTSDTSDARNASTATPVPAAPALGNPAGAASTATQGGTAERRVPDPIPPTTPASPVAIGHVANATQNAPYVPLPPESGDRT